MSRLTPLSTSTCIRETLCDEPFELAADVGGGTLLDERAVAAEEDEVDRVAGALLVAQERLPRTLGIDAHRLRIELAFDRLRVAAGEAECRKEPERDSLAVRQVEVGRRFERMREGVA